MFLSTLIFLILILIILFLWQSHMRSKELALKTALHLCEENQVQLFDQTVSLREIKFKRLANKGSMAFWRSYEFDYGVDNKTRNRGKIIIHGNQVLEKNLKFYPGPSVLNRVNLENTQFKSGSAKILKFKNLKNPANQEDLNPPEN